MKHSPAILCIFASVFAGIMPAATTVDRIVTVVGKHPIKLSDIRRDLRVTQFLNGEAADASVASQQKSLERLIDQELIRADMASVANTGSLEGGAKDVEAQLVRDRFAGSKPRMAAELGRRGLSETQLLEELQWQLVVLRFIDQRFRPGIIVSDEEVASYYAEHRDALRSAHPGSNSLETLAPAIRDTLVEEGVNRTFEEWLTEARMRAHVEYKAGALS